MPCDTIGSSDCTILESWTLVWISPVRFGPEKDGRWRHGAEAAAAVCDTKRHRPSPHPRETLVEGEAGDLIPSFPFAEAGFGEEDARGTRIVLPSGVEQGMKEGNSFVPCSVFMGWLCHYQGVYIPRSNFMDIKFKLWCHQKIKK